ncbi:MAG TPA: CxxxxCH/CxxCH domain-containing protein [Desulfuromonadaceae bacterium]
MKFPKFKVISLWFLPFLVMAALISMSGRAEAALQCNSCHGTQSPEPDYRPLDTSPGDILLRNPSSGGFLGNHRSHMDQNATPATCSKCHPGSQNYTPSHRKGSIKISPNINKSQLKTSYKNSTSAFSQVSNPAPGSCNNVNCHFEAATPNWGVANLKSPDDCNKCHGAPPEDGAHKRKHNAYYGPDTNSCSKCHSNHLGAALERDRFAHATSAGRSLAVQFTSAPNNGGFYNGSTNYPKFLPRLLPSRKGSCSDVYCHSDANSGPSNRPPLDWATGTSQCYSCHKGRSSRPDTNPPQDTDNTEANCIAIQGKWSSNEISAKAYCTPDLVMRSNGHHRLVGGQWIRKYPCYYCHYETVDVQGNITSASKRAKHVNGTKNVVMAPQWNIEGKPPASYDPVTKICDNVYCHSDGTTKPEKIRAFPWNREKTECWACHGHYPGSCSGVGCHDGIYHDDTKKVWPVKTGWAPGSEWMGAMPMFKNEGPGKPRANSHDRHTTTDFTCDVCHAATIKGGDCKTCHIKGIPPGGMGEVSHLNAVKHVDKDKTVVFRADIGGTYNPDKSCSNTKCHPTGKDPVWGGSVNTTMTCLYCHGTAGPDVDDYGGSKNGIKALINTTEWEFSGHGRISSATTSRYPVSNNPAANFSGNPCWYCHDNNVLHNYTTNRFRLRMHTQYERRFEKECVYCHMEGKDYECLSCHNINLDSLAPQLGNITSSTGYAKWANNSTVRNSNYPNGVRRPTHRIWSSSSRPRPSCMLDKDSNNVPCHFVNTSTPAKTKEDVRLHNSGAGLWSNALKDDIKNQYMMMGVCLQCHDDDSGNQCNSCHDTVANPTRFPPEKYRLGFDPVMENTRYIKPKVARASSSHFGYKHWRAYLKDGTWKGGKFCWNCHDPHGDANGIDRKNIYMIHDKVATVTDARQGVPVELAQVTFVSKADGLGYVRTVETLPQSGKYNGICNVCHSQSSKHFTRGSSDTHNIGRPCTVCHEHRFADSHADKNPCNSCHKNSKPVPKHNAFGQPADCVKCHSGIIGNRMDIMGQMGAMSHHVQGVPAINKHCYACHWESTPAGTIDPQYHEGYDFKHYTSVKNAKVDLVIWGPGVRPTTYKLNSTASIFQASDIMLGGKPERDASEKITSHCLGCHSDQNNNTDVFGDCKTPRQYAWDRTSVAARYSNMSTTTWGKYVGTANASKKNLTKAFSAHGQAKLNAGGFSMVTGEDSAMPNTRAGNYNVQCYDCHNSHGSKVTGVTSSYVTFNGTKNGANLKETQAWLGGYKYKYQATANPNQVTINTYYAGAGQCFDCHLTEKKGGQPIKDSPYKTPWGYKETFGAISSIRGYFDTFRFDIGVSGFSRTPIKSAAVKGGHNNKSSDLISTPTHKIDHLCTPCHDPHGVSPTLGNKRKYAVPLLKGTWMTSPYKEDQPIPGPSTGWPYQYADNFPGYKKSVQIDQNTFGNNTWITETEDQFAGLCLQCHPKSDLTKTTTCSDPTYATDYDRCIAAGKTWTKNTWQSKDRIHEAVKGWKTSDSKIQHQFTCSKCHAVHVTNMPRLMVTNCLDFQHRGGVEKNGQAYRYDHGGGRWGSFPSGGAQVGGWGYNVNCHPTTGGWPDNYWNSKTKWSR